MTKVICTSAHAVDLSDGRTLAPGESATEVDIDHDHQKALVLDGHLYVLDDAPDDEQPPASLALPEDDDDNPKES